MEHNLNRKLELFQISEIRKFNNYASNFENVIKLTLGEPHFSTPQSIVEKANEAFELGKTKYTSNRGSQETLQMISKYMEKYFGYSYSEEEIIMTVGAQEALALAFLTLLNDEDEVIIPAPNYPGYEPLVEMFGGIVKHVSTVDTNFVLTKETLDKAITSKTKAILLTYPNNPTGTVMTEEQTFELYEYLKEKNIYVVLDEVYNRLLFENEYFSLARYSELREKVIVINAFSKSHAMTGWRIGFAAASKKIITEMTKIHQYLVTSKSSIAQHAVLACLDLDINYMVADYEKKRDYCTMRLDNIGLDYQKPSGGFYIFVNVKKTGLDGETFAHKLLEKEKVAVIPGIAFGKIAEDYIRISFPTSLEILEKAFDKIENFIKNI